MTDNLKQRIAEAIGEAIAYSHGFASSQPFDDAAQAVLDIVEPLFPEYKEFLRYMEMKRLFQAHAKSLQKLASENFNQLTVITSKEENIVKIDEMPDTVLEQAKKEAQAMAENLLLYPLDSEEDTSVGSQ